MTQDDIDLPDLPAVISGYDEDPQYTKNTDFESLSTYDSTPDVAVSRIKDSDLAHLTLNELDKKVLVAELADCNMYLRNIHKGFKHVTSTKSLISLVAAGIGVHKHRRSVLKDISNSRGATFELDEYGNPKKS
jgi:hypothetical protein